MSAESNVLQEYLIRLGWDIQPAQMRRFNHALEDVAKLAKRSIIGITGVAVAAEAMVERYARSMQSLHYLSQRTGASVKAVKGLEFAFEQIGLKAEDARAAIEGMSTAAKLSPGLVALMQNLGVNTKQDTGKVFVDLLGKLKEVSEKQGFYVAAGYGEQFGFSPQMLQQVFANFSDLNQAIKHHGELLDETGQDQEKAAKGADEFMKAVGDLYAQLKILGGVLAVNVLPYFKEFNGVLQEIVKDVKVGEFNTTFQRAAAVFWVFGNAVQGLANSFKALGESWDALKGGNIFEAIKAFGRSHTAFWKSVFSPESTEERDANASLAGKPMPPGGPVRGRIGGPRGAAPAAGRGSDALIDSIIRRESGGDQGVISPKGAIGTMQLLQGTARDMAKQLGIPFSLQRLMIEAKYNVQLGTEYLNTMMKRYGGNQTLATAAYNAGPDSVDRWLKKIGDPRTGAITDAEFSARIPYSETRGYVDRINRDLGSRGIQLHQTNTISVTGGGDPVATGRAVEGAISRSNADLTRNLEGAVDTYE